MSSQGLEVARSTVAPPSVVYRMRPGAGRVSLPRVTSGAVAPCPGQPLQRHVGNTLREALRHQPTATE